jgi:hypothetical protein
MPWLAAKLQISERRHTLCEPAKNYSKFSFDTGFILSGRIGRRIKAHEGA